MTTTDVQGVVEIDNSEYFHLVGEPTDGAAESALNIRDISGAADAIGKKLAGHVLTRLALQASDGSILTSANLYDGKGARILALYGGERLASSNMDWALELEDLSIPIDEGMTLKIVTAD